MIAVLDKNCPLKLKADIVRVVEGAGFRVQVSEHDDASLVGVIGPGAESLAERLAAMPGVIYGPSYRLPSGWLRQTRPSFATGRHTSVCQFTG